MKSYAAILLAATLATSALAQNSTADLLKELQAQRALLEEQKQDRARNFRIINVSTATASTPLNST